MSNNTSITLPEKISLINHPYIRLMIRDIRKENNHKYTAEELSTKIGKSKSWLAQIENGRLNSISKSDLFSIMKEINDIFLYDNIEEETISAMEYYKVEYERKKVQELDEQQDKLQLSKDIILKRDISKYIFIIRDSILNNFDSLNQDEKQKILTALENLNKNIKANLSLSCILLSLPIHAINCDEKNVDKTKKFISDINLAFTDYLSSTLND